MREHDVNRPAILLPAIAAAVAAGFEFNPRLRNKSIDEEGQRRWRERHEHIPTSEFVRDFMEHVR